MSAPRHDFTPAQLAGCVGKYPHRTWAAAEREAARLIRIEHSHFEVYRCSHCGHLHVGEVRW